MDIVVLEENPTLLACNVPEDYYQGAAIPLWVAGTYDQGYICYLNESAPHMVYKCLENSVTEKPGTGTKWDEIDVTDRYLMLDLYAASQTTYLDEITFEIDASYCDTLGLFGLETLEAELELWYAGQLVKSETIGLHMAEAATYESYYRSDYRYQKTLLWQFPFFSSSTIKARLPWKTGEKSKLGVLAVGNTKTLGGTLYNPNLGLKSFSKITEGPFGRPEFTPGAGPGKKDVDVWFPTEILDEVYYVLEAQDAKPTIFNANNPHVNDVARETFITYGFYRSFNIDVPGPKVSRASIQIEGIV